MATVKSPWWKQLYIYIQIPSRGKTQSSRGNKCIQLKYLPCNCINCLSHIQYRWIIFAGGVPIHIFRWLFERCSLQKGWFRGKGKWARQGLKLSSFDQLTDNCRGNSWRTDWRWGSNAILCAFPEMEKLKGEKKWGITQKRRGSVYDRPALAMMKFCEVVLFSQLFSFCLMSG